MATQTLPATQGSIAFDTLEEEAQTAARRRVNPTVAYVARRVGLYLVTLWGSLSASFIFFRLIPGDPISAIVGQLAQKGQYSTQGQSQELVEHYRHVFGLDGSLFHQYVRYMNRLILHQDFGPSIVSYPKPA